MSRWIGFLIAIAVGIGLGLIYGWVINPIEYVDTSPGTLKFDYKTDYILMVAETYRADGDLPAAARRLALLQEMPLSDLAYRALLFAQKVGYSDGDLTLLQELHQALLTYDLPSETITPPPDALSNGIISPEITSSGQETPSP
jgi:hypothetical protein